MTDKELLELEQQERTVKVPEEMMKSDAEFWINNRAAIIEACEQQGFSIYTTINGTRLVPIKKGAEAMSAINNGGQAFPWHERGIHYGMTLRDWFAGQALMGMMASRYPHEPMFFPEREATYVYAVADAMLKARAAINKAEDK